MFKTNHFISPLEFDQRYVTNEEVLIPVKCMNFGVRIVQACGILVYGSVLSPYLQPQFYHPGTSTNAWVYQAVETGSFGDSLDLSFVKCQCSSKKAGRETN